MPELPEVETVTRALRVMTEGKTIASIDVYYDKIIANVSSLEFKERLVGQTIESLGRRGKFIIFTLTKDYLISHLRMEGCYYLKHPGEALNKHEHIVFNFTDDTHLVYRDVRKFGRMWLYSKETDIYYSDPLHKLGFEPFEPIDLEQVYERLQRTQLPIKESLLDQSIICGIGNIYASEILYACHINPLLPSRDISKAQVALIVQNTRRILQKSIDAGGSTIKSFMSPLEMHGAFQNDFKTYHCEVCSACGQKLENVKIGGRSSFYCVACQPLKSIKVVGLTGSIACGKSMVTQYLLDCHYPVIDCDKLSKEVYTTYTDVISQAFKDADVFTNNVLDRQKLGRLVFNHPQAQKMLEGIIHPLVITKMLDSIAALTPTHRLIFVDVPLLYESGSDIYFDDVWVVSTSLALQIERLMERDHIDKEYACAKINSQMPVSLKEERADYVLKNNKELAYLYKQIDKLLKKYKK